MTARRPTTTRTVDEGFHMIGVRTRSLALKRRFRVACAEEGLTGADLLKSLLDLRDERKRRSKAAMKHPLDIGRVARVEEL